jgi:hypothetical protein
VTGGMDMIEVNHMQPMRNRIMKVIKIVKKWGDKKE